ncbi:hypothetical protein [Streptomyces sp. NPDC000618]|uniref:hypothetical protein n=1 Tax=Streptomyces sp. NPDC000618 TaxID=3154265 RepID=UPI00332FCFBD
MDLLIGIVEKTASALAASGLSLLGLRMLRPRIDISPEISAWWSEEKQDFRYSIKISNKTRRALVEPRFELTLLYPNERGATKSKLIPRGRPDPMSISGRKKDKVNDKELGTYTIAYGGQEADLLLLAGQRTRGDANRAHFRFRCFVRDGLSGIGRQFETKYEVPADSIVFGTFKKGRVFDIDEQAPNQEWTEKVAAALASSGAAPAEGGRVPRVRNGDEPPPPVGEERGASADGDEPAGR